MPPDRPSQRGQSAASQCRSAGRTDETGGSSVGSTSPTACGTGFGGRTQGDNPQTTRATHTGSSRGQMCGRKRLQGCLCSGGPGPWADSGEAAVAGLPMSSKAGLPLSVQADLLR